MLSKVLCYLFRCCLNGVMSLLIINELIVHNTYSGLKALSCTMYLLTVYLQCLKSEPLCQFVSARGLERNYVKFSDIENERFTFHDNITHVHYN